MLGLVPLVPGHCRVSRSPWERVHWLQAPLCCQLPASLPGLSLFDDELMMVTGNNVDWKIPGFLHLLFHILPQCFLQTRELLNDVTHDSFSGSN